MTTGSTQATRNSWRIARAVYDGSRAVLRRFLLEDADGCLQFSPSYSPENHPGNNKSQACVNATMDIAVARELLTNLIAACEELDMETEAQPRWRTLLAKLPAYQINPEGAIKEWAVPDLDDNYAHRHCSHL